MPMRCYTVQPPRGTAIVRMRVPACQFCRKGASELLCDFDIGGGKTCDARMCRRCGRNVGPDRDYCPRHKEAA